MCVLSFIDKYCELGNIKKKSLVSAKDKKNEEVKVLAKTECGNQENLYINIKISQQLK